LLRRSRITMAIEQRRFSDVEPDYASAPGTLLAEELAARGMTQKDLASAIGRSEKLVSQIVHGKKAITADTALQLEEALGVSARIWVGLEADYRLFLARRRRDSA